MDRLDRFKQEARFTAGAKAVSALFIIGVVLLLVAEPAEMPGEHASASAAVVALHPTR